MLEKDADEDTIQLRDLIKFSSSLLQFLLKSGTPGDAKQLCEREKCAKTLQNLISSVPL